MNSRNFSKRVNWLRQIDGNWTLFLDRDGVINKRLMDDYVKTWEEFEFIPGVLDAIKVFNSIFGYVIIVSNQQGIGKGIMKEDDLNNIHAKMIEEINRNDGRIDSIFFSPDLAKEGSIDRKPGIGMALKAKKVFPVINFKKSVMVGDTLNDMKFGKRLKMLTVLISDNAKIPGEYPELIDIHFENLYDFSIAIK
ncbi:D-glycero-alpha-D-manno-heptose-1,7-bisphosphate 7-phosphatase [Bacteroidota bacterium]